MSFRIFFLGIYLTHWGASSGTFDILSNSVVGLGKTLCNDATYLAYIPTGKCRKIEVETDFSTHHVSTRMDDLL